MSEPTLPEEEQDPFWITAREVDVDALSRQIRLMDAAGKTPWEIHQWLLESGCPVETAELLTAANIAAKHEPPWRSRKWGRLGALLGLILAVVATVAVKPWNIRWVNLRGGQEIDPVTAIGFYWCGGFASVTMFLWFLGSMFGAIVDTVRDRKKR